ncbi:hypothetical protein CCP3SC1AL1_1560004 [Gammaproteobacteria bacterium]
MESILKKIECLSKLSQETGGASFVIQHLKSGKFKVVFQNVFRTKKPEETDFETAIDDAIKYVIEARREIPTTERYTLYKL